VSCPVDHSFDPLAPDYPHDPFAVLATLEPDTPVFYTPLVPDQELTLHPNISFRRPQQLWVTVRREIVPAGGPERSPASRARGHSAVG
jgi:hypothetical protein